MPAKTGPTGCSRYSKEVTTPKFPPPPRRAQKRSACSVAVTVWILPLAVTRSAEIRLSHASPYRCARWPQPPPSVTPAIPVVEIWPPVVARPKAWVSRSNSPHVTPGSARRAVLGIDPCAFHRRQVDHQTVVACGVAGDVVAATAHRHQQLMRASEVKGIDDVGGPAAACDHRRPFIDHTIPDSAGVVVADLAGTERRTLQRCFEVLDGDLLDSGIGHRPALPQLFDRT